jgi:uncharacterized protein
MTIPPRFPEFKPVGLEDKEVIDSFIRRVPSEACEIIFTNIFIWRHYEHPTFTAINGNLCVLCRPRSEPAFFLPPIGTDKLRETIEACLSICPRMACVPESFALDHCAGLRVQEDPENFDYVYRVADLVHLRGKKYDGKRNRIKKFEKSHASRYLKLEPEHLGTCRRLFEEWFQIKARENGRIGETQRTAVLEILADFGPLGLSGGAVEVDGRIEAFSIGERLNPDTAVIHLEIADPRYDGLAQFINREFVKNEWAALKYINREQDMGVAGLRRAKMSYYPHHLVKKFIVLENS